MRKGSEVTAGNRRTLGAAVVFQEPSVWHCPQRRQPLDFIYVRRFSEAQPVCRAVNSLPSIVVLMDGTVVKPEVVQPEDHSRGSQPLSRRGLTNQWS